MGSGSEFELLTRGLVGLMQVDYHTDAVLYCTEVPNLLWHGLDLVIKGYQ